jgi:hypothetical protein
MISLLPIQTLQQTFQLSKLKPFLTKNPTAQAHEKDIACAISSGFNKAN